MRFATGSSWERSSEETQPRRPSTIARSARRYQNTRGLVVQETPVDGSRRIWATRGSKRKLGRTGPETKANGLTLGHTRWFFASPSHLIQVSFRGSTLARTRCPLIRSGRVPRDRRFSSRTKTEYQDGVHGSTPGSIRKVKSPYEFRPRFRYRLSHRWLLPCGT